MQNKVYSTKLQTAIMNGEDYIFVKLDKRARQYTLSDKFTLIKQNSNELCEVVRVIKRFI
jgi:hypothetical protein